MRNRPAPDMLEGFGTRPVPLTSLTDTPATGSNDDRFDFRMIRREHSR